MSFNEAAARLAILVVAAAAATASFTAGAAPAPQQEKAAGEGARSGSQAALTAQQAQALARARAALELDAAARPHLWPGLEVAAAPLLVREARPGREPFVILIGHPAPPEGLTRIEGEGEDEPPAFVGRALETGSGGSPVLVKGVATASYALGDVEPPPRAGDPSAEAEILGMLHQLAHAHMVAEGGAFFAHREPPAAAPKYPEGIALAGVECRVLAEILFTPPGNKTYTEDLARQFIAVRRARERLMGEAAADFQAHEVIEGLALFAEFEALRLIGGRQVNAPAARAGESGYDGFKYGAALRMTRMFASLLETPSEPAHVAARSAALGAAQAALLDRLGADWRGKILTAEAPVLGKLLAEMLPLTPAEQEERLTQARTGYSFEALLAIARERAKASG